jgi:dolichol-phosphate mannosyltransferase
LGSEETTTEEQRQLTLLSVVAPMFEEEQTAAAFCTRVREALESLPWELIVVDDGSKDGTGAILAEIAASDPRVKVVTLARNFGHQPALSAGLEHADGDVVAMIDSDLQDPPELIVEMVERWRTGADVVYAVRKQRAGETRFKLLSAHIFYRLLRRLTDIDLPADAGDFRLMDRRALDALLAMRERARFLRGMTVWVGYTQTAIEYERDARYAGETKYTLKRMLRFSLDAIVSFSSTPLQLATVFGFLVSALAFVLVPFVIVGRVLGLFVAGIPTTLVVILMLGGVQLICVGIIGEYLGRIYDEVKRRPLYVVRDRVNFTRDQVRPVGDERRGPAPQAPSLPGPRA